MNSLLLTNSHDAGDEEIEDEAGTWLDDMPAGEFHNTQRHRSVPDNAGKNKGKAEAEEIQEFKGNDDSPGLRDAQFVVRSLRALTSMRDSRTHWFVAYVTEEHLETNKRQTTPNFSSTSTAVDQYGKPLVVPHSDAHNAPAPATATSETRCCPTTRSFSFEKSWSPQHRLPWSSLKSAGLRLLKANTCFNCAYGAKKAPNPSQVFGVFGLSIRTQERDLDEEFSLFGGVEKVTIVPVVELNGVVRFPFMRTECTPYWGQLFCLARTNTWGVYGTSSLGTPTQAQAAALTTATPTVIHIMTTIITVPIAIRIGTPTAVTAVIGAIVAALV
ncbi:hypothetical protein DFJ58DRAFT_875900 [Suillus subalutaceus]|uniref:uncharacterized protein n=1 Tax=Suillus subalutaceus TaxID=48586 RepID=UPI001B86ED5B|nr:uncharacterized protein DFJ58DRAFT_875900 [Suillus subalutaceus]KAG1858979.1 hypothetical protein DFJ58DRAFT_875900 [Suillus subalutaceus]